MLNTMNMSSPHHVPHNGINSHNSVLFHYVLWIMIPFCANNGNMPICHANQTSDSLVVSILTSVSSGPSSAHLLRVCFLSRTEFLECTYLLEFNVLKEKIFLIILIALTAHSSELQCHVTAPHALVWDYLQTSICYPEYLHDCLSNLICEISSQWIRLTTTHFLMKSVIPPPSCNKVFTYILLHSNIASSPTSNNTSCLLSLLL
jgi:hypothetical protein